MDFIDELKRRASLRHPSVTTPVDPSARALPAPVQAADPHLQAWYAFLHELSELLRIVNPEVTFSYGIKNLCTLHNLRQGDYDVRLRDAEKPSFSFDFFCHGRGHTKFSVETRPARLDTQEFLERHRLRYRVQDQASWQYIFFVEETVPVSFVFEPDRTRNCLKVDAFNVDILGASTFFLDYSAINRELMCEFAKRVVRKGNRFAELTGHRLSEDMRKRLKEKVEASKKARRAERDGDAETSGTRPKASGLLQGLLRKKVRSEPSQSDQAEAAAGEPPTHGGETSARETDAGQPARPPGREGNGADAPSYAWMITGDQTTGDTSASVGKLGPLGAAKRFAIKSVVEQGEHFRLRDAKGKVAYSGYILGHYSGIEPLLDYGMHRGCVRIEFERAGRWIPLDPKTIELDSEAG